MGFIGAEINRRVGGGKADYREVTVLPVGNFCPRPLAVCVPQPWEGGRKTTCRTRYFIFPQSSAEQSGAGEDKNHRHCCSDHNVGNLLCKQTPGNDARQ
jgi:hypothetical protein